MLKLLQPQARSESGSLFCTPGHPISLTASSCSKNIDSGFTSLSSVSKLSWVHVSAITGIYWLLCLPRVCLSLSQVSEHLSIAVTCLAPKRRGHSVPHTQCQDIPLTVWEGTRVGSVRLPGRSVLGLGWLLWVLAKCSWATAPSLLVNQHCNSDWKSSKINT